VTVVLPVLRSVAATEIFVVHQLDASLADEVALLEILVSEQLLFTHLANEAHHVRRHRRVRIVSPLHRLDVQLRKGHGLCLDRGHLRHAQIFGDRNGTGVGDGPPFLEARFDLLRRYAEDLGEEGDDLLTMRRIDLDDRTHDHAVESQ
jgi:hypothetical protein